MGHMKKQVSIACVLSVFAIWAAAAAPQRLTDQIGAHSFGESQIQLSAAATHIINPLN
jgi:hypothetical protein